MLADSDPCPIAGQSAAPEPTGMLGVVFRPLVAIGEVLAFGLFMLLLALIAPKFGGYDEDGASGAHQARSRLVDLNG